MHGCLFSNACGYPPAFVAQWLLNVKMVDLTADQYQGSGGQHVWQKRLRSGWGAGIEACPYLPGKEERGDMNEVDGIWSCAQPEEQAAQWGGKEQVIIVGGQPYQNDAEYGDETESMCGGAHFIRAEQGQAGEYDCEGDGPLEWQTLQELRSGQLVAGGAAPDGQQHAEQQAVTAQYHHRQGAFLQQLIEHDQQQH